MKKAASRQKALSATAYGVMALVALIAGAALLVYYVWEVPHLEASVRNQVYYVVLFPSAVASALALFGALRSYGRLTARQPGFGIELGGPAVLFAMILWGGIKLVPQAADTVDLTVRAHSTDGADPLIALGAVTLELDRNVTESFRPSGEAEFKIPSKYMGKTVRILPRVEGYEQKWQEVRIVNNALDLALQPSGPIAFQGFVHDEEGKPIPDVTVVSPNCGQSVQTNNRGMFAVRGNKGAFCHLVFSKSDFLPYNTDIAIDGSQDQKFELHSVKPKGRGN